MARECKCRVVSNGRLIHQTYCPLFQKEGANERLGLPRQSAMKTVTVAFDVDGTLRNNRKDDFVPNERIRSILVSLASFKNTKIVVWSGSGKLYAAQAARELGVADYVDLFASKTEHKEIKPDIAIDDIQDTAIGKINLIVREK